MGVKFPDLPSLFGFLSLVPSAALVATAATPGLNQAAAQALFSCARMRAV
jgi:hypothetical protein